MIIKFGKLLGKYRYNCINKEWNIIYRTKEQFDNNKHEFDNIEHEFENNKHEFDNNYICFKDMDCHFIFSFNRIWKILSFFLLNG